MCGFCGMIGENASKNNQYIKPMMNKIIHRGPDQEGTYKDEKLNTKKVGKHNYTLTYKNDV